MCKIDTAAISKQRIVLGIPTAHEGYDIVAVGLIGPSSFMSKLKMNYYSDCQRRDSLGRLLYRKLIAGDLLTLWT